VTGLRCPSSERKAVPTVGTDIGLVTACVGFFSTMRLGSWYNRPSFTQRGLFNQSVAPDGPSMKRGSQENRRGRQAVRRTGSYLVGSRYGSRLVACQEARRSSQSKLE
jgi:hypothetical protein